MRTCEPLPPHTIYGRHMARADWLGTTNVQGTVEAMDACLSLETNRRRASLSRCRTGFDLSLGAPAADLLTLL